LRLTGGFGGRAI